MQLHRADLQRELEVEVGAPRGRRSCDPPRVPAMEFGLLVQGHVPGPAAHDTAAEHAAFLHEAALVQHADRHPTIRQ